MLECPYCGNKPKTVRKTVPHRNGVDERLVMLECPEPGGLMTAWHETKAEAENAWDRIVARETKVRMESRKCSE